MKKAIYDKANQRRTIIMALEITVLEFLSVGIEARENLQMLCNLQMIGSIKETSYCAQPSSLKH